MDRVTSEICRFGPAPGFVVRELHSCHTQVFGVRSLPGVCQFGNCRLRIATSFLTFGQARYFCTFGHTSCLRSVIARFLSFGHTQLFAFRSARFLLFRSHNMHKRHRVQSICLLEKFIGQFYNY